MTQTDTEREPKTDQDPDGNKDRRSRDQETEAPMEPQMKERRSQLSKRAERHSKEERLQMLRGEDQRLMASCSALHEAVVSIDLGVGLLDCWTLERVLLVLPWGRSPARCWCPFQTCPLPLSPILPIIRFSYLEQENLLLSTNLLTKVAPILSYPTLPEVGPMLSTLSCFSHPLTHQLAEKWQG